MLEALGARMFVGSDFINCVHGVSKFHCRQRLLKKLKMATRDSYVTSLGNSKFTWCAGARQPSVPAVSASEFF